MGINQKEAVAALHRARMLTAARSFFSKRALKQRLSMIFPKRPGIAAGRCTPILSIRKTSSGILSGRGLNSWTGRWKTPAAGNLRGALFRRLRSRASVPAGLPAVGKAGAAGSAGKAGRR